MGGQRGHSQGYRRRQSRTTAATAEDSEVERGRLRRAVRWSGGRKTERRSKNTAALSWWLLVAEDRVVERGRGGV